MFCKNRLEIWKMSYSAVGCVWNELFLEFYLIITSWDQLLNSKPFQNVFHRLFPRFFVEYNSFLRGKIENKSKGSLLLQQHTKSSTKEYTLVNVTNPHVYNNKLDYFTLKLSPILSKKEITKSSLSCKDTDTFTHSSLLHRVDRMK